MEDTGSKVPCLDLLFLLRDRQHAWERLEWKRTTTVVVPHYCKAYDLVAGVFASSDGQNLNIFGLPSNGNEGYGLTRTPNFPIRDFAIDPTEDVVAFLEESTQNPQRTHIRKISTNAPLSILTFTVPPDNDFLTLLLQFGWDLRPHWPPLRFTNSRLELEKKIAYFRLTLPKPSASHWRFCLSQS
jgi:hypothetical protein